MKTIIHRAADRGFQDHGWLKAAHSFSFGGYHDPKNVRFGQLRVLNDDIVSPGAGFGMHPHDNMEIVTIPLRGELAHKDSLGSEGRIAAGEVQIMSAGTGIRHSEFNASHQNDINLLQIWIFPKVRNIDPRYDQKQFGEAITNAFRTLVAPDHTQESLWINQDAWFSIAAFDRDQMLDYELHSPDNGVYLFVIEGAVTVNATVLGRRDAAGVFDTCNVSLTATPGTKLLAIEVPME